jgi:hypothetical protein
MCAFNALQRPMADALSDTCPGPAPASIAFQAMVRREKLSHFGRELPVLAFKHFGHCFDLARRWRRIVVWVPFGGRKKLSHCLCLS